MDKTDLILKLIREPFKFVFISRPRHFGKSLLVSTIREIFRGKNKEMFKDTAIYASTHDWTEYPVVRIDFSRIPRNFLKEFQDWVKTTLRDAGNVYGIPDLHIPSVTDYFGNLTKTLYAKFGKPVVILIEEYDWSHEEKISDFPSAAEKILQHMRNFYTLIKSQSEIIRFCFVTTVTGLSKAGRFSGFDGLNLVDVSSEPNYAEITGFTIEEMEKYFDEHVEAIAHDEKVPKQNIYAEMVSWYGVHNFSTEKIFVFNPHTILTHLQYKKSHDVFGFRWGLRAISK